MGAGDVSGLVIVVVAGAFSLVAGARHKGRLSISMGALAVVGALLIAVPKTLPTSAPPAAASASAFSTDLGRGAAAPLLTARSAPPRR